MLYDPKWEKPDTKPDVFSLAGFMAWLERQPADQTYDWYCTQGCAVHLYLVDVGCRYGCGPLSSVFPSTEAYWAVCLPSPHTFGAALDRARKLASSPVQP